MARHHEGRDPHVLADVRDAEPLLGEVDGDPLHGLFLPSSETRVQTRGLRETPTRRKVARSPPSRGGAPTRSSHEDRRGRRRADDPGRCKVRIRAETLEAHRFGTVRRGYDPAEVDAIIAHVADTLRGYEAHTARLEARLAEADEATAAMRRLLVSAQRTHDELVEEGRATAERLVAEARKRADELVTTAEEEAEALLERAAADAEARLADAEARAHLLERDAAEAVARAHRNAEELLGEARRRVAAEVEAAERARAEAEIAAVTRLEDATGEAAAVLAGARREADALVQRAREDAVAALREAKTYAAMLVAAAEDERAFLEERLHRLRSAVAAAERELESLAVVALERTRAAGALLDLEAEGVSILSRVVAVGADTATVSSGAEATVGMAPAEVATEAPGPDDGRLLASRRNEPIADPDGSGLPPVERRVIVPEERTGSTIARGLHGMLKRHILRTDEEPR
ncbi:MAG TPA: DivIVA domain-containing protein [Actinobacteria bacterium]|nr:DivIVA domain-containing protein [Actinomycetota bacterium]